MIPVELKKEPQDFDEKVRKPGLAWLNEQDFSIPQSLSLTARESRKRQNFLHVGKSVPNSFLRHMTASVPIFPLNFSR